MKILNNPIVQGRENELRSFIECDNYANTLMSLETVVHEAIHFLDAGNNLMSARRSFRLVADSTAFVALTESAIRTIEGRKLNTIHPSLSETERTDMGYADNYLKGDIGNQDLFSLPGELNAYANGLDAAIHLPRLPRGNSCSALAGPLAMVVFTSRYYEYFEAHEPVFFQQVLMDPPLRSLVKTLIRQALDTVKAGRQFRDLQFHVETWEKVLQVQQHQRMLNTLLT